MIKEGPTAKEIERFVIRSKSDFIFGLESLHRRADALQRFNHYTGDPGYFRTWLAELDKLSAGSIKATAGKWLSAPHAEIVTVQAPAKAKTKTQPKSDAPTKAEGKGAEGKGQEVAKGDAKAAKGGAK